MDETKIWTDYLLDDNQVAEFVIDGYTILDTGVDSSVNHSILNDLNRLDKNPGDLVTDAVPQLEEIYDHPKIRGAVASLLGHDYEIDTHRHCHRNPSGSRSQIWHQDSLEGAQFQDRNGDHIKQLILMYYPQEVNKLNGPTALIPGSHLLSDHSRDRTASQGNFKYQVVAEVPAGHVLILHYDIWHAGTSNVSGNIRYMVKFLFGRVSEPSQPPWKHNPSDLFEITKLLDSQPTRGFQPSLAGKIRYGRRQMWNNLCGSKTAVEDYYDQFAGAWPVNSMR